MSSCCTAAGADTQGAGTWLWVPGRDGEQSETSQAAGVSMTCTEGPARLSWWLSSRSPRGLRRTRAAGGCGEELSEGKGLHVGDRPLAGL